MTKRSKIIIGVIIGVLLAGAIVMSVFLGIYVNESAEGKGKINVYYEKSYLETMDSLDNASTKLSKVIVITGEKVRQQLLADVWKECDIAVTNFTQLGTDGVETETITKFLNQVGDYAYYLMVKGEQLTKEEKDNVKTFVSLLNALRTDLEQVADGMVDGDVISADTLSDLSAIKSVIKSYSSIDYPELIYDGPFSDGLNDRTAKFLSGKDEISKDQAINVVKTAFEESTEITVVGESSSSIPAYVVEFNNGGKTYSAFITKQGGYFSQLNGYADTDNPMLTEDECVQKASAFLAKIGYENMTAVWTYNNNSTVYVNFAYTENETVFYPDLIKVKISLNDGEILGMEANNYIYNHGARGVDYDKSAESAITKSGELELTSERYCVIPTEWNTEVYCKEIVGTCDGMTYYLYYDLSTGEEIRAMVVIDQEGNKLI